MMNVAWFKNPDHVAYCKEEEILPKLSRELGINDLAQRVEAFRKEPSPEGENIKGRKRTTLKLMIPNLTFSEPVDMGENVWIYMGDLSGMAATRQVFRAGRCRSRRAAQCWRPRRPPPVRRNP